ncbi:hypothetical protein CIB95_11615 [Lottiidibacillus patelloidae]|uniref:Sugar 3,4-ketoisomerase QdtA cupin domain-containing protein n=1 Tax=Lottiidibacillus patelloidae TaxID=2670334 RepID=A0A263BRT7_9BACI|nr:FdtA/QdtA family cupin domain-containing protein [Lottiidibacillus patelloidae]OZM56415.1 hypothetical protein CIB95_11615 [Lottiidibacillus patelloidae]
MDKFLLNLTTNGDKNLGFLSFFETGREISFEIKRIYYTYDVPIGTKRGMHAHKKLKQILWCPYGQIEVILNDGVVENRYILDSPDKALLVSEGYWHDMYWRKEGSVLCVAASDYYNEEDYIRDYDEFIELVKRGFWNEEKKYRI